MRVVFVGRQRVVWKRLLLYLATFGITRRVWLYRIEKELDGHQALALRHKLNVALLCLPILGPSFVTARAAKHTGTMLKGSGFAYGPWFLVYMATWVPILGNLFFIGWTQDRLNKFWVEERKHPEHGVEIDLDLSDDPKFLVELQEALKDSMEAGSRFDRAKARRRERIQGVRARWDAVQEERLAVRAAGGSTPVRPWKRPERPAKRKMHVTCGQCANRFDVVHDPVTETVLHCPKCGLHEVLPGLASDPFAPKEKAAYAVVKAQCPDCATAFETQRVLDGPTPLVCPGCGRADELPAPQGQGKDASANPPKAARSAKPTKAAKPAKPAKKAAKGKTASKKKAAKPRKAKA